jgi:hypothetical protein
MISDSIRGFAENGYRKIFVSLVQKGTIRFDAPTHAVSTLQSGHICISPVLIPFTVNGLSLTQLLQN